MNKVIRPKAYHIAQRHLRDLYYNASYCVLNNIPVKPDPRPECKGFYEIYQEFKSSIPASATSREEMAAAMKKAYEKQCRKLRKIWASSDESVKSWQSYNLCYQFISK